MRKSNFRKNFQVIYGIILVVLVPIIVVVNTLTLNSTFRENIDVQLHRQALSLGRTMNATLQDSLSDRDQLQIILDRIIKGTPDIKQLEILEPQIDGFQVIASTMPNQLDKQIDNTQYFLSWHQNEAIASLLSRQQLVDIHNMILSEDDGERFWLVTMPLKDSEGIKKSLLVMSVSLDVMDNLIGTTLRRSYVILALTVLLLILLLAANARLFEYAVLYRKIKEVDEMKDEFISIASHELRTPLTVIRGYVTMLRDGAFGKMPEKTSKALNTINSSVDRLAGLVEDLLQVSRIEQGRLQVEVGEIDPQPLVEQTVEELKIPAQEKKLDLKLETQGKMPEVKADPNRLKQVLVNIIGNSIKYTPQGSVKVSWEMKDKKYLQLKVTDTGIGMTAQERERLFEKFYRIKKDETKSINGTGLGLWITKQMIELMHGKIYVDSIENVGTDVTILLLVKNKKTK